MKKNLTILPFVFGTLAAAWFAQPPARAAEVFQVTAQTKAALPAGKEADGMIGDWLIRNDLVVAVIGKTSDWRDANQMVEGVQGAVIDFTTLADNNDELVVFYPMGYRPTGVSANRVEVIQAKGKSAEFKVIRDATAAEPFTSTTIYTLNDGEPFLRVRTLHENKSGKEVTVVAHDWLRLDNDIAGTQPKGDHAAVGLDNKWFHASYALAGTDGRTQRAAKDLNQRDLRTIGSLIYYPAVNPEQKNPFTLAAGQTIELNRFLFVERDAARVQIAALRALGRNPAILHLRATEKDGRAIPDVFVDIAAGKDVVTNAITDAHGNIELNLPDGSFVITATQIGRPSVTRNITVSGGKISGEDAWVMEPISTVTLDVAELGTDIRMPVKIEFRPKNNGLNPNLGPMKRPNGAGNAFFSAHGLDTFPAPAGTYEVHVSRGPEYSVLVEDFTVPNGGNAVLKARLKHEMVTPHWIIADLHNHSTGSGDSTVELSARVLNLACGGVEFGPATEHNRISTYTPTIKELGIEKFLASAAGMELSGRPGPGNTNHQIGFPLELHEDQQGYGAPRTDIDPLVQMQRLYDLDHRSPKLMQHNHPDIGWLYFDKDRDGVIDQGFGTRSITDVLEVREAMLFVLADTEPDGKPGSSRAFHWLQMLNQGDKILGTANTDAHSIGSETGSIFNYVYLEHDDIATLDPWDVARAVKRGHVVMSNGPFMTVTINGAMPGDTTTAPKGSVAVKIKVEHASWSRIDRVQILVNGRQVPEGNFTRAKNPELFSDGLVQFEREVPLDLKSDAHIIVVAAGEHETNSVLLGGKFAKTSPMAMSNPIFVDVDGGGFTANKDTLGAPLPNGKPKAAQRNTDNE